MASGLHVLTMGLDRFVKEKPIMGYKEQEGCCETARLMCGLKGKVENLDGVIVRELD